LRRHEKICRSVSPGPDSNETLEINLEKKDSNNHDSNRDLFDRILAEDSSPSESAKRDPEIQDYNDMLESLIASTSPDELILKSSITNELPDVLDDAAFTNCKRKHHNFDESQKKKKKNEEKVHNTHDYQFNHKDPTNEKTFTVLNASENCKSYDSKSKDLSYRIANPARQTFETTAQKTEELSKHKTASKTYKSVTKKIVNTNKKCKRGSLGWQLHHQMDYLDETEDIDTKYEGLKEGSTGDNIEDNTNKNPLYNESVLKNLYSSASRAPVTENPLEIQKQNISKEDKSKDVEEYAAPLESESTEPSPQNIVYDMPVLDFL